MGGARSAAWGWVAAVGVLVAAGCARRGAADAAGPLAGFRENPGALVAKIAAARQLPERRPTPVHFHEERSFQAVVAAKLQGSSVAPTESDRNAFYVAFGFPLPSRAQGNTPEDVQKEQLIAFYDEVKHVVHVRLDAVSGPDAERDAAWVVAHEIGHSLQYQHFRIPEVGEIPDEDGRLAALAMIEGDAMLTMLAFAAKEQHVPLTRALVRGQRALERGDFEESVRGSGKSRAFLASPSIMRERMSFPYLGGMQFMGTLYRAGGFALVNRVYEHPPATSEQVLHAERYLAGEPAVDVAQPSAPAGFRLLGSGRMGELQIRVALEQCLGKGGAHAAAEGWGGDSFSLAVDAQGRGALSWSTSWDTEADAVEFERAVGQTTRCWANDVGLGRSVFAGEPRVARAALNVAVVRGLPESLSQPTLTALLALPRPRAPSMPPLGSVALVPIRPEPRVHPDVIAGGVYHSERLGISAPVPPDFSAKIDEGVTLSREGRSAAMAGIFLSDMMFEPASSEELFNAVLGSVRRELPKVEAHLTGVQGWVTTPLGAALARNWQLDNGARMRLLLVPICRNTGALFFVQVWGDPDAEQTLDWWLSALRPLAPGDPPVCAELDP
jgi:hypothetical protein